jgi:hypothetical protein
VVQEEVELTGGDLLVGFSASAWSENRWEPVSMELWLDDQPVPPGFLLTYANHGVPAVT